MVAFTIFAAALFAGLFGLLIAPATIQPFVCAYIICVMLLFAVRSCQQYELTSHEQNVMTFILHTGAPYDTSRWQAWERKMFAEMFPEDGEPL